MAGASSDVWVLEYLLEQDAVDDAMIKRFYDGFQGDVGGLPPQTQARLMLRVLRDSPAALTEASLNALNCLSNFADDEPSRFAPYARLPDLRPSLELYIEVKTQLVLRSVAAFEAGGQEDPVVMLNHLFPVPENEADGDFETARRLELTEGLKSAEGIAALRAKHPIEIVTSNLLNYVSTARQALGPPLLKLVEEDVKHQHYNPYLGRQSVLIQQSQQQSSPGLPMAGRGRGRGQGPKRKRAKGGVTPDNDLQAGASVLANMQDPNNPQQPGQPYSDAMQAAMGGQLLVGGPGAGRQIEWGTPGADGMPPGSGPLGTPMNPDGTVGFPLARPFAVPPVAPAPWLQATPNGPGTTSSGGPRRRNGRWSEEETSELIRLVREYGKGKWKRILETSQHIFVNRSQVDLKDKWRNLERQGVVGPQDLPLGQAHMAGTPQMAPDMGGAPLHMHAAPDGHLQLEGAPPPQMFHQPPQELQMAHAPPPAELAPPPGLDIKPEGMQAPQQQHV